ncbi:hypothetical protein ACFWUP_20775 [Nocardia sp. NPDC058658]|uniref:hypothetical protein n=1 Tax=Nocardia sp. NPDC058658 TaxID=3346580 RepID=UPI00364778BE
MEREKALSDHFVSFANRHDLGLDRTQWPEDLDTDYYCEYVVLDSELLTKGGIRETLRRALTEDPRVAPVVDGYDEEGHPLNRRPLIKKLHQRLLDYLESAPIIWSEPGFGEDEFALGEFDVPLNYRCDGAWIWAGAVPHYFRKYEFCPDSALVDHIVGNEFHLTEVDEATRQRALGVIIGQ